MMFQSNIQLQALNTLKVACTAKYYIPVTSTYQLLQIIQTPQWEQEKHRILWGGANTLFVNEYFDGLVLQLGIKGIKVLAEKGSQVILQVGAGEKWTDLIAYCLEHQLGGLENMTDIPGNVGTSAVSNTGAYGQEACNCIYQVVGVHLETKTIQKLSPEECHFAYRESIFKHELEGKFIITHIEFALQKVDEHYLFNTQYTDIEQYFEQHGIAFEELTPSEKIQCISKTISKIRAAKMPDLELIGTAGSFFKNPEIWLPERESLHTRFPQLKAYLTPQETMKLSAAQLIEYCGWKGKSIDGVQMSPQHALILLNNWTSGTAIANYAKQVQQSVYEQFGILLEPEVRYCS